MKIRITMDLDDEWADREHSMGITEDAFVGMSSALGLYGTNIDFEPAPEED